MFVNINLSEDEQRDPTNVTAIIKSYKKTYTVADPETNWF